MDYLNKIIQYQKEILNMQYQKDILLQEFREWASINKNEIKKILPVKDKVYQIISMNDVCHMGYHNNNNWHYEECDKFYFLVTDNKFDARHQIPDISVKGRLINIIGGKTNIDYTEIFRVNIFNLKETDIDKNKKINESTFIYIMIDKNTGYYKIGRSKNPIFRERTLQSEKPTIELLRSYDGKNYDETNLHEMFKYKRVRGEWFNLCGSDLDNINIYFEEKISNINE